MQNKINIDLYINDVCACGLKRIKERKPWKEGVCVMRDGFTEQESGVAFRGRRTAWEKRQEERKKERVNPFTSRNPKS